MEPSSPEYQILSSTAPIIPTKMLTGDPDELDKLLQSASFAANQAAAAAVAVASADLSAYLTSPMGENGGIVGVVSGLDENDCCDNPQLPTHIEVVTVNNNENSILISPASMNLSQSQLIAQYLDTPETETYEVELRKNVYGLGISVAGYVCEEEDLSGIFVKSIIEGSAADLSNKILVNDRIIAVDGKSLAGVSNYQAVEILKNTDIAVNLTLERFLRGRKYEHLQVALVDGKDDRASQKSLPCSPSVTTLSICQAKSDADSIVTECGECEINAEELYCSSGGESNSVVENGNDDDCEEQIDDENESKVNEMENPSPLEVNNQLIDNDEVNKNEKIEEDVEEELDGEEEEEEEGEEEEEEDDEDTPIKSPSLDDMMKYWREKLNRDYKLVTVEVNKLSGLGISIEGTVEVEAYGVEMRPHHYIRSILIDGPVGKNGRLRTGDELLQVNEHRLQGLKHIEVVNIIKNLPERVKICCARGKSAREVINTSQNPEAFEARSILTQSLVQSLCLPGTLGLQTKALSESSLYTSSSATMTDIMKSKSVENVSGIALWTEEITWVCLEKKEKGFGFSILDYQDPLDCESSVIVVRGLIPGGAAESANLIFPGDRIVSVNEHNLRHATLDEAVQVLKSIPLGYARIGLCRPFSTSDNNLSSNSITPTS
jgi:C-terminal processing protease CtpA/Prc